MISWRSTRLVALPFLLAAGVVALLLFSDRGPSIDTLPFEKLAIDPKSLREVFFESDGAGLGRGQWALQYSVDVTERQQTCESLLIRKQLYRRGAATAVATNGVVSTPTPRDKARVDHTMLLSQPLEPGSYTLVVGVSCQIDSKAAVPAEAAPVCFDVPETTRIEPWGGELRLDTAPCL